MNEIYSFYNYFLSYSRKNHMICKVLIFLFLFYRFKFRATNVMGQFTDSDYSDPVKTLGKTYFEV